VVSSGHGSGKARQIHVASSGKETSTRHGKSGEPKRRSGR
jgi:hypothetical protein